MQSLKYEGKKQTRMPTCNEQKSQIRRGKTQQNRLQKFLRTELITAHPLPSRMSKKSLRQTQNHELSKCTE